MSKTGTILTGIGGWTFEPWEGKFYPDKLVKRRQLEHASRHLTAIEVNGTYYGSQKPETFAKWASEVPEGFIFSLKASRYVTNRKVLAEASDSMTKFLTQGLTELGDHLGPILWQFAPTKKFEPDDFGAFLALLPEKQDGLTLQHVVEVRHPSFQVPEFIELLSKHKVAVVCADHHDYPMLPDVTADFVYCRLQKGEDDIETCYPEQDVKAWAKRLQTYAVGSAPDDLQLIAADLQPEKKPRDVFAFFISGGKVNAPEGAQLLQTLV